MASGQLISVGERYPQFMTGGDLIQAHFSDDMWSLNLGFPGITAQEVAFYTTGVPLTIGFTEIDGLIFFLFKIGHSSWFDAPFEPALWGEDGPAFKTDFDAGTGAPMIMYICDTSTGELKRMRAIGLAHYMSVRLHQLCNEHCASAAGFSREAYQKKVAEVYRRFPTSDAMVSTMRPEHTITITEIP